MSGPDFPAGGIPHDPDGDDSAVNDMHGDDLALADEDALPAVYADLRTAFLVEPDELVVRGHLAAMLAASRGERARDGGAGSTADNVVGLEAARRGRRRRLLAGAAAVGVGALLVSGVAAAQGSLPDPVQNLVSKAAGGLGVDLPAGDPGRSDEAPGRGGENPGKSDQAPGQQSDPGNSENAPGHGGDNPGKADEAPGQTGAVPPTSEGSPGQSGGSNKPAEPPGQADKPVEPPAQANNPAEPPGQAKKDTTNTTAAPGNSGDAPGRAGK